MKMLSSLTTTAFGRPTGRAYKLAVLAPAMINRSGISLSLVRVSDENEFHEETRIGEKKTSNLSGDSRPKHQQHRIAAGPRRCAGQVRGKQAKAC